MRCVLVPPHAIRGQRVVVTDPGQLHHLLRVLRIKTGDLLECLDGQGGRYTGRVLRCASRELVVQIDTQRTESRRALSVTLAQALITFDRFEWAIQKATELGADRIMPLVTARTVIRPSPSQAERRGQRWQRIIQQAAQQCGRPSLPVLEPLQPFEQAVAGADRASRLIMPTLAKETVPLREGLAGLDESASVTILIGPEGDFTPAEAELAARHGAVLVSLGPRTLRAETAAIATLAIVQQAAGVL